jgi:hypothetical protein
MEVPNPAGEIATFFIFLNIQWLKPFFTYDQKELFDLSNPGLAPSPSGSA